MLFKRNKKGKNTQDENLRLKQFAKLFVRPKQSFGLGSEFISLKTKNYQLITSSGFTLIETMVAISIMLLAITSPLILAKQGMVSARQARNSITAFYMAQDAIEYVRNVRDPNLLSGGAWLNYLGPCLDDICQVDTLYNNASDGTDFLLAFDSCDSINGCPVINKKTDINGDFDYYLYNDSYPSSGFTRNVTIITTGGEPEEVKVEVEITWDNGRRSFSVSEILKKLVE